MNSDFLLGRQVSRYRNKYGCIYTFKYILTLYTYINSPALPWEKCPGSKTTLIPMSVSNAQVLVPGYHYPLKGLGLLERGLRKGKHKMSLKYIFVPQSKEISV